jgi:DNA-binding NarL/FixJ family response regulator
MAFIEPFLSDLGIHTRQEPGNGQDPGNLSSREVEVLRLIAAGSSNAQIAAQLAISQHTVIRHVSHILVKTGSTNRTEAATFGHRHGLLS